MFFTMDKSEFTPSGKIINLFSCLWNFCVGFEREKKVETSFIISGGLYWLWLNLV